MRHLREPRERRFRAPLLWAPTMPWVSRMCFSPQVCSRDLPKVGGLPKLGCTGLSAAHLAPRVSAGASGPCGLGGHLWLKAKEESCRPAPCAWSAGQLDLGPQCPPCTVYFCSEVSESDPWELSGHPGSAPLVQPERPEQKAQSHQEDTSDHMY